MCCRDAYSKALGKDDTVIGAGHSHAVVTLVERKSDYAKLIKVANKTAELVSKAIEDALKPVSARVKTLTVDNGKDFAYHQKVDALLNIQPFLLNRIAAGSAEATKTSMTYCARTFPRSVECKPSPMRS